MAFKIGDKVQYILAGKVLFTGVIIAKENRRGFKPNIIKAEDGTTKYANPQHLKKVK